MSNHDIIIDYVDEIKCKITTKKEILYSLRNKFSFYADGYRFNNKYKQGLWDGKINMIDIKGFFPSGILKRILRQCKEDGLSIKVNDIHRYKTVDVSPELIQKLCSYSRFEPYDYQQTAIKHILGKKKLLLKSPTSSGKSLMIYLTYRWCVDNDIPMLITVPSTSLAEQLISDFKEYVSDDHDVDKYVDTLYSGKDKGTQKLVIISTWQTCSKMSEAWIKKFKFYSCDECFVPTSRVLTPNGYVEIQNLNIGDKVINYSEETKEYKEDTIVKVHKNLKKSDGMKIIKFKFDNDTTFECTENHEILTTNGWKQAKYINEYDEIVGLN